MDGPLPIERSEDRDQPGVEQLPDERIGEHVADEAATRGRSGGVTHPGEDTRRAARSSVCLCTLMVTEVTLSPETIAAELRPVLLRLARELRKETEQLGITSRQATLLWLVKRSPGLSLAELAAEEGISPPAMSGHVDRLEKAGLLNRLRSTNDRRRVGLRLTDEGERLMRRVRARRTTWLADRLRTLEPEALESIELALPALLRLVGDDA